MKITCYRALYRGKRSGYLLFMLILIATAHLALFHYNLAPIQPSRNYGNVPYPSSFSLNRNGPGTVPEPAGIDEEDADFNISVYFSPIIFYKGKLEIRVDTEYSIYLGFLIQLIKNEGGGYLFLEEVNITSVNFTPDNSTLKIYISIPRAIYSGDYLVRISIFKRIHADDYRIYSSRLFPTRVIFGPVFTAVFVLFIAFALLNIFVAKVSVRNIDEMGPDPLYRLFLSVKRKASRGYSRFSEHAKMKLRIELKFSKFPDGPNANSIKCPICRKEIPEGYAFCPFCGYHLRMFERFKI